MFLFSDSSLVTVSRLATSFLRSVAPAADACRLAATVDAPTSAPLDSMKVAKKKRGKTAKVMKAKEQHDRVRRDKHGHKLDSSGKRIRAAGAEQKRKQRKGDRHKRDEFGRKFCRGTGGPLCPWGHVLMLSCGTCAQQKGEEEGTKGGFLLDCKKCGYYACVCDLRFHDFFK